MDAVATSHRAQRQLVLDASHELRTPLTSLRTNVEIVDRLPELPPSERRLVQRDMLAEIKELTDLVGNLTSLVRGERHPLPPEAYWLDAVVARSVSTMTAYARTKDISISTMLEPTCVHGHPDELERAVSNLLSNAIKWGPAGSEVEVVCRSGIVRVKDRGPGIAEEDLPFIFDRFYRSASDRSLPGSGLGLAIVAQAVATDVGSVAVANRPHGGAEFSIRLGETSGCP